MLPFLSGCGVSLTPAEQAEVNRYIEQHGTRAIPFYLADVPRRGDIDEQRVLRHLRFLVSQGADVNANADIGTPLHIAARGDNIEIVRYLISRGANVNATTGTGETPLHGVASVEIATLLVSRGADVNAKGENGLTPLDRATGGRLHNLGWFGNASVAEYLESIGAQSGNVSNFIPDPDLARHGENNETAELLISTGATEREQDIDIPHWSTPFVTYLSDTAQSNDPLALIMRIAFALIAALVALALVCTAIRITYVIAKKSFKLLTACFSRKTQKGTQEKEQEKA